MPQHRSDPQLESHTPCRLHFGSHRSVRKNNSPSIAADGSPPRRQVPEQRLVQGAVCVCGVRSCEHNVLAETAGPTATWEPVRLETRTLSLT
jgi:hypothetical protein